MEKPRNFPCITIEYCTQCKWLLRAAYFAQELLSTFSTTLGEVALRPSTGGNFVIEIIRSPDGSGDHASIQSQILWDRRTEGGFPETKELKCRVRDIIDPARNLGHIDGHPTATLIPSSSTSVGTSPSTSSTPQVETPPSSLGGMKSGTPIPKAIGRLQEVQALGLEERKFTPMEVDIDSGPGSRNGDGEGMNERGKILVGDEQGVGICGPSNGDCG